MDYNATKCPGCEKGTVVRHGTAINFHYTCSRAPKCKWQHIGLVQTWMAPKPKELPKKKAGVKFQPDSAEFQRELRAVVKRRMFLLKKERAKLPKKLNDKQRAYIHKFYVDVQEIREELLNA